MEDGQRTERCFRLLRQLRQGLLRRAQDPALRLARWSDVMVPMLWLMTRQHAATLRATLREL
eukprot:1904712-Lingulodinium_polyedra.AAC.1